MGKELPSSRSSTSRSASQTLGCLSMYMFTYRKVALKNWFKITLCQDGHWYEIHHWDIPEELEDILAHAQTQKMCNDSQSKKQAPKIVCLLAL